MDRAAALVIAIASAPRPPTVADLAEQIGVNRTTAWRLLGTLEYHHFVSHDPDTQGYVLGPIFTRFGDAVSDSVVRLARPVLTTWANKLDESLTLAIPHALGVVYADQVDPPGAPRASWVGQTPPLHATSAGKVFLASLPRRELGAFLDVPLASYTPRTITDPDLLEAELALTRERGFAVCDREYERYSSGAAAAVMNQGSRPVAIVATWNLSRSDEPSPTLEQEGALVRDAAREIQKRLSRHE